MHRSRADQRRDRPGAEIEGTLVSTGADSLLTTITQTDPIWVRFSVADSELDSCRNAS